MHYPFVQRVQGLLQRELEVGQQDATTLLPLHRYLLTLQLVTMYMHGGNDFVADSMGLSRCKGEGGGDGDDDGCVQGINVLFLETVAAATLSCLWFSVCEVL